MRLGTPCLFALVALSLVALSLGACANNPFQPYGTDAAAAARNPANQPPVLTYDPNVRIKTEEESWPVAWAQMQPRRVIEP